MDIFSPHGAYECNIFEQFLKTMFINWKRSDGGNKDSQQKHNSFNLSEGLVLRREPLKYERPYSYKPDILYFKR